MRRVILLLCSLCVVVAFSNGQEPVLRSAIHSPVLVTGCESTGSGFYWVSQTDLYFVTAAHVLFNGPQLRCPMIRLESHSLPSKNVLDIRLINLDRAVSANKLKKHDAQDIAVIYLGSAERNGSVRYLDIVAAESISDSGLLPITTFMPFDEVRISNDVYLLGYPSAVGMQEIPQLDYSQPLLRKGVVAGKNLNKRTIIIDCPSYPGNSGGPVLEIDETPSGYNFRIIGVLTEFIPFAEKWVNSVFGYSNLSVSNSGYSVVVPIDFVRDVAESIPK